MADIVVEKGKLNGNYKPICKFSNQAKWMSVAWAIFYRTELEAGEKKRIRVGKRTLKQTSCYWT